MEAGTILYAKTTDHEYRIGTPIFLDGMHDKYGVVVKVTKDEDGNGFRHVIRGTGKQKPSSDAIIFDRM